MSHLTPDNSQEGIHERLARAHHEAQRVGTQRHRDTLRLMRRLGDDVFRYVSSMRFVEARRSFSEFRRLWHEAPADTRGATFSPAELEKVIRVSEGILRSVAAARRRA